MQKRHVRRRPAKPLTDNVTGVKGTLKRFFLSFTPAHFRTYWISRAGLIRLAKLAGAGAVFVFLVFLWYAKDLPTPGKIRSRITAQTTKFYDASGNHLLYELSGDQNRSPITFDQIPAVVKQSTIAIEDKDFYNHGSFSVWGYLRAGILDLMHRNTAQGGSTITQQYVKNALLDPTDHSFGRKIKELFLSMEIGQFYSKNDILTLYLNEIPYGNRSYGIESACKAYFPQDIDKTDPDQHCAKNLNLGQAALLAAVLNGPTYFSPYGAHQDDLIDRQHIVLDLMVQQKYVTQEQADAAKWKLADLSDTKMISQTQNLYANLNPNVAHFVLYAQEVLEKKYGNATVTEGGLKVYTTMDYDKQVAAYNAIQANRTAIKNHKGSNSAMVVTDPKSGHILSMVGSADFNDTSIDGQFNVATAKRQPGSSFKPIVYSTLFNSNKDNSCTKDRSCPTYGPGTVLYDVPTEFGTTDQPYHPKNFGNKNYGIMTVRRALAGSLNVPAVKSILMAGIGNSLDTARTLGITTLGSASQYGPSLVLGTGEVQPIEMANAYESFANGGQHYDQTAILKVWDQKGNVMEDNTKPGKPRQALDPQVAYLMADVLADQKAKEYAFTDDLEIKNYCANNNASNCVHYGVKTGTTEHYNDAWTVGFTPDMVAAVWVGNNNNAAMDSAAADIAAPVWRTFMNTVVNGKPNDAFVKPAGIKVVTLDRSTGRLPGTGSKDTVSDIFPSWYVPMSAAQGKSADVDKVSGKLATQCTPPLAKDTAYSSAILPEITKQQNAYQYQQWLAALQKAYPAQTSAGGDLPTSYDDVHNCSDTPPTAQLIGANGNGQDFNVKVTAGQSQSGFTPNKLEIYWDDQIISTQQIDSAGTYPVSYTPTASGSHTVKAVVTDTGLYQGTDTQTVLVVNPGGGGGNTFQGLAPLAGSSQPVGSVTFSWSLDPGAGSYTLFVDGSNKGSTSSNARTITIASAGNHSFFVRSDQGNQTASISFKLTP
ncbi:MAG TPA: transglycosylase domain-containing protein [Candidatus Saccharimonadia bacterium]